MLLSVMAGGGVPADPVFGAAGWLSGNILQLADLVFGSMILRFRSLKKGTVSLKKLQILLH